MNRNRLEIAVRALYLAASVVITVSLISLGIIQYRRIRSLSAAVQKNVSEITQELTQNDIIRFDGMEVTGSEVVNFYRKHLGSVGVNTQADFCITIVTDKSREYSNGTDIDSLRTYSSQEYVNPMDIFMCKVTKNGNGVITNVSFTKN